MRITEEQRSILEHLICERISADTMNVALLEQFVNAKGSSLIEYLKTKGLQEEHEGKTAYYVIKTEEKDILMFFSIKCGTLFRPLDDEEKVVQDLQSLTTLLQAIENESAKGNFSSELTEILGKYQEENDLSGDELNYVVSYLADNKKNLLNELIKDRATEDNDNMFRVLNTYPGIELVHICTNDSMKDRWEKLKLGHPMGETLFWYYIVPIFFDIQKLAGCEYVFLFAADLSEARVLVNYYNVVMKFRKSNEIGANKPLYNFCCEFMCQRVNEMKLNRERFLESFNED